MYGIVILSRYVLYEHMTDESSPTSSPEPTKQNDPKPNGEPSAPTGMDAMLEAISDPKAYLDKYGGAKVKEMMEQEREQALENARKNAEILINMSEAIDTRFQRLENMLVKLERSLDLIKRILKNAAENEECIKDITIRHTDISDGKRIIEYAEKGEVLSQKELAKIALQEAEKRAKEALKIAENSG